jgi:hypothetical protein
MRFRGSTAVNMSMLVFESWCFADLQMGTSILEEHTASISPEDGDSMFLQNAGTHLQVCMASQLRIPTRTQNITAIYQLKTVAVK